MRKALSLTLSVAIFIWMFFNLAAPTGSMLAYSESLGKPLSPLTLEFSAQGEPTLDQAFSHTAGKNTSGDPRLDRLNQGDAPAAGTVTVFGFFYYTDKASVSHPIPYARVDLYDDDGTYDPLLGTTYTNASGYFQRVVNNDVADPVDIYAVISTRDDLSVRVTDFSDPAVVYSYETQIYVNRPDGNLNIGSHTVTDSTTRMAWYIYDTIADQAYNYLFNQVGWINNYNLQVRWSPTNTTIGTQYNHGGTLDVLAGDRWDEDVVLHEYSHFVMYKIYASFPPTPNCSPHAWGVDSSAGCAWVEGWAYFLQGAIQGSQDYVDTENQVIHYYLELPTPAVSSDLDEASVAASLWDIFDTAGEAHDTLSDGLNDSGLGLWDVVFDNDPNTAHEFWDDWFASSNGDNCAVHTILEHHKIYTFDPCSPIAPTVSDGIIDNVTLDWPDHVGATYYQVYRAASAGGSKTYLGNTTTSDFADPIGVAGQIYYYFYRACNAVACGDYSAYDTGWRKMNLPTGVVASDGAYTDTLRTTWDSMAEAMFYDVYAAELPGDTPLWLGRSFTTSYDYAAPVPEKLYYLWVKACNGYGCSDFSANDDGYREMPAPTNLIASDGAYTRHVHLNWSGIPTATYYKVYRGTSPGGQVYLADSSDTFYDDPTATPGLTYYYYIQAFNDYGSGAQSSLNGGWRAMPVPAGLYASDGAYSDKVSLSWNSVPEATYYDLYRATTPGSGGTLLSSPTVTTYNDTSATLQLHYYYTLRACNAYICSALTGEEEGWRVFAAPASVSASNGLFTDMTQVTFNIVSGATQYQVYRGTAPNNQEYLGTTNTNTYNDTSGTPELVYYYDVAACNAYGCGTRSVDNTGWIEMATPTGFSASDAAYAGYIRLDWSVTIGATYYKIYRGPTAGSMNFLGDTIGSPFDDAGVTPNTTYYYAVAACNGYGCGAQSSSDSGSAAAGTRLSVLASDGTYTDKVRISWSSAPGATRYEVYRLDGESGVMIGETTGLYFDYIPSIPVQLSEYYIKACDEISCGDPSDSDSGWRNLVAPSGLLASDGTFFGQVRVTWNISEASAPVIELYRAAAPGGPWEYIPTGGYATVKDDPTPTPETTFYYRARACNAYGCSGYSNTDTGWRKTATASVAASDGAFTEYVTVTWTTAADAEFYYVYATNTPSVEDSWELVSAAVSGLSFEHVNSWLGETWYYAVRACKYIPELSADYCAERGPYDSGWRAVPAPSNVQASDGSVYAGVQISWTKLTSSAYVGYDIFRSESPGGPKDYLGRRDCPVASCDPTWIDTAPAPGEVFYYWVMACNGTTENSVCSEYSSTDGGYPAYPVYLPILYRSSVVAAQAAPRAVSLLSLLLGLGLLALWRQWRGMV